MFIQFDPTLPSMTLELSNYGFSANDVIDVSITGYFMPTNNPNDEFWYRDAFRNLDVEYGGTRVNLEDTTTFYLDSGMQLIIYNNDVPLHDNSDPNGDYGVILGMSDDYVELTIFDPLPIGEDEGPMQFQVMLSRPLSHSVYVNYHTQDGSAEAGYDFEGIAGQIIFSPGEMFNDIWIEIIDDDIPEEDESFSVVLSHFWSDGDDLIILTKGTGIGTIVDNDSEISCFVDFNGDGVKTEFHGTKEELDELRAQTQESLEAVKTDITKSEGVISSINNSFITGSIAYAVKQALSVGLLLATAPRAAAVKAAYELVEFGNDVVSFYNGISDDHASMAESCH